VFNTPLYGIEDLDGYYWPSSHISLQSLSVRAFSLVSLSSTALIFQGAGNIQTLWLKISIALEHLQLFR